MDETPAIDDGVLLEGYPPPYTTHLFDTLNIGFSHCSRWMPMYLFRVRASDSEQMDRVDRDVYRSWSRASASGPLLTPAVSVHTTTDL